MSGDPILLKKLATLSLNRRLRPSDFLCLFEQLNAKSEILGNEYAESLISAYTLSKNNVYLDYALGVSFSNGNRLSEFWKYLPNCLYDLQRTYLKKLPDFLLSNRIHGKAIDSELFELFTTKFLQEYTQNLLKDLSGLKKLDQNSESLLSFLVLLWCFLVDKYLSKLNWNSFKSTAREVNLLLTKFEKLQLKNYFTLKTQSIISNPSIDSRDAAIGDLSSIEHQDFATNQHPSSLLGNHLFDAPRSTTKAMRLLNVKKYIWFDFRLRNGGFLNTQQLLSQYETTFNLSTIGKDPKRGYILFRDILKTSFRGYLSATIQKQPKHVVNNWRFLILSDIPDIAKRLDLLLNSSTENTLDSFESIIQELFKTFTNDKLINIKKEFITSCLFSELVTEKFVADTLHLSDISKDVLMIGSIIEKFKQTVIEVKSEFVSLEESGLVEFFQTLPTSSVQYSRDQQIELCNVFLQTLDDLILDKSNEKLHRLLLVVLNDTFSISVIAYRCSKGPKSILDKLTSYIDNDDFSSDDNFQETYGQFGTILQSALLICNFFHLDYADAYAKKSYSFDYFNNFANRLNDHLSQKMPPNTDEDKTIIENYNGLISDWINALFDDSEDGLSDDLFKSVNVKQIYKIIPIIYQQSVIACEAGKINEKILNGGFDYLTQSFLIPCCQSIFTWILRQVWIDTNLHGSDIQNDNILLVKIIHFLLKSNLCSENGERVMNENFYVFKLILANCGSHIIRSLKQLKDWETSTLIKDIITWITESVDRDYLEDEAFLNFKNIEDGTSIVEFLKHKFLQLTDDNETTFVKYDTNLVEYVLKFEQRQLLALIVDEIESSRNPFSVHDLESNRIILNLMVFIFSQSITSSDQEYWLKILKSIGEFTHSKSAKLKLEETAFNISMASHFSSIFNVADDAMDDDLFNEHFNLESTQPKISADVNYFSRKFSIFNALLMSLVKGDVEADLLSIFKDKLVEELEGSKQSAG